MKKKGIIGLIAAGAIGISALIGSMSRSDSDISDQYSLTKYADGSVNIMEYGASSIGINGKTYQTFPVRTCFDKNGDGKVDIIMEEVCSESDRSNLRTDLSLSHPSTSRVYLSIPNAFNYITKERTLLIKWSLKKQIN